MPLQSYRDLEVWQVSMELVKSVYRLRKRLPAEERFGLVSQMQRAAVSIPANIAEGYGRSHRGDYLHHLSIAKGSLSELETLLLIAEQLEYVTKEETIIPWQSAQSAGRMLTRLIVALKATEKAGV
jgi:four helix bundle protein